MVTTTSELVFIPTPGVGHIMSMVEMAKLVVNRDRRLSVTFLIMKFPFETGVTAYIESLNQLSIERIRFIDLPRDEALPAEPPKSPLHMLYDFIDSEKKYVRDVVEARVGSCAGVVGFVVDSFCTSMIDVAEEFGVPTYVYFTSGAAYLGFKLYTQGLIDSGGVDVTSDLAAPSFINPVPAKVFPPTMRSDFALSSTRRLREVKGIAVNTFLELETHGIESLSAMSDIPPVYPVGPVLNLTVDENSESDIVRWLDDQPPRSVVFLCFGSFGSFGEVQVREIAGALEASGHRFLWSLRRPPSKEGMTKFPGEYEDPAQVLPQGFLERTRGVGKVIGWAPQVAVLSHPAVGGFVSHCGWNSILESLWCGVPVATWPMYAEQQINAFEMVVELGLAAEIKLDYTMNLFTKDGDTVIVMAEEIERGIRKLMEGENGIREKVKEMSEKSKAAITKGGSSYDSLARLIDDMLEKK